MVAIVFKISKPEEKMLKDAMGGYRGTEVEINRVIMKHPGNAEAYYNRANTRSSCRDYDGAVSDYTIALQIGLRLREALNAFGNRGMARVEAGDLDGAIADFSDVILRKPKNRSILRTAYKNRALVREKKGDREGAASDRERALLLLPDITKQ